MEPALLIRTSAWLFGIAALVGAFMAALRFAMDRPPPTFASKLHGYLAIAGLALLLYGWATMNLPRLAVMAAVLLSLAAIGGVMMVQVRRWRRAPSAEALLFGHMSLAFMGFILLVGSTLAAP